MKLTCLIVIGSFSILSAMDNDRHYDRISPNALWLAQGNSDDEYINLELANKIDKALQSIYARYPQLQKFNAASNYGFSITVEDALKKQELFEKFKQLNIIVREEEYFVNSYSITVPAIIDKHSLKKILEKKEIIVDEEGTVGSPETDIKLTTEDNIWNFVFEENEGDLPSGALKTVEHQVTYDLTNNDVFDQPTGIFKNCTII